MKAPLVSALRFVVFPAATFLAVACGGSDATTLPAGSGANGGEAGESAAGASSHAGGQNAGSGGDTESGAGMGGSSEPGNAGTAGSVSDAGSSGESGLYLGPTVGSAKSFAALAYSAITAANISPVTGELGVSAGAMSKITGFDAPSNKKYGTDSLAPNSQRTILAQQDVTALVGNIDPRACDVDLTNVVGGLTGDITLHPGVTCMNSFSADVLLNGHVTLDAGGDPNAFFIIRSNLTLTAADAAQVVLTNGAQACGVFWRVKKQVTIGKTVQFYGTVIAGTAIVMKSGSTLVGRALAQTAGVMLDANTITIPIDETAGSPGACTHVQ
ncbi:MAG TPA: ice-binding family protein [Polyangiaceae bacterium]|nr:ice-binding family protein [Polyangiaceae bacterium]